MAKFKKVEVTEEVSTFKEQDNREVDAEIIEAMKEGQAKIEELESENEVLRQRESETASYRVKDSETIAKLRNDLEVALKPKDPPKVNKKRWAFIHDLRLRDTPGETKTCAGCTKRCTWKEMDYGKSDFCDKCLGK